MLGKGIDMNNTQMTGANSSVRTDDTLGAALFEKQLEIITGAVATAAEDNVCIASNEEQIAIIEEPLEVPAEDTVSAASNEVQTEVIDKSVKDERTKRGKSFVQIHISQSEAMDIFISRIKKKKFKRAFDFANELITNDRKEGSFALSYMYANGYHVPQSLEKEAEILKSLARKCFYPATYTLALHLYNGNGTKKNIELAREWMNGLANVGFKPAISILSRGF